MTTEIEAVGDIEAIGANFSVAKQMDVRARVHRAIHDIAAKITPGMVEEDAVAMARELLSGMDMRKGWHRVIVRFGPNTTKDFEAESDPGVVLGETDIYFIDIGPVFGDTEGDQGQSVLQSFSQVFASYAAEGVTVYAASGDNRHLRDVIR